MSDSQGTQSRDPVDLTPIPHLELALQHKMGSLDLDVAFNLTEPWSLLFAPSGAGKTSILRAIAGLLRPKQARIVSRLRASPNDTPPIRRELLLTDTAAGVFIPPHRRVIRMVGQNAALFPHLNVLQNVRYQAAFASHEENRPRDEDYLELLLILCRIDDLKAKMPSELSGGERQRVALARSLATGGCRLLLLDEPFTGLDATLRDELIADLQRWLIRSNTPVLSVTHDVAEAFQLQAEVIRLDDGRVIAQGPADLVLKQERLRLLDQLSGKS